MVAISVAKRFFGICENEKVVLFQCDGRVAERFKAPVLKTGKARKGLREFESHPFRHFHTPLLGVSHTDLAQAVGVMFQQLQKYENGKNRASASRMQQLAKCLNVPLIFFFEGAPEIQVIDGRKSNAKCAITPGYVTHFLTSPEGQDIMKAFSRISNRQMRRELVDLAQQLASNSGRLKVKTVAGPKAPAGL